LTEDGQFVKRVRFECVGGDITYKPKLKEMEMAYIGAMPTSKLTTYLIKTEDFIKQNPVLTSINENVRVSGPQEIVLTYAEIDRYDEDDDEVLTYKFTTKGFFDLLYYVEYHKTDVKNLESMKEIKTKFEGVKREA
jgi:hypothetical protein